MKGKRKSFQLSQMADFLLVSVCLLSFVLGYFQAFVMLECLNFVSSCQEKPRIRNLTKKMLKLKFVRVVFTVSMDVLSLQ